MSVVTREEIIELIGDVSPASVERIIATGVSSAELAAAIDELEGKEFSRPLPEARGRIARAKSVIAEILDRTR